MRKLLNNVLDLENIPLQWKFFEDYSDAYDPIQIKNYGPSDYFKIVKYIIETNKKSKSGIPYVFHLAQNLDYLLDVIFRKIKKKKQLKTKKLK